MSDSHRPRLLYVVTLAETGGAQSYVRDLLPAAMERFEVSVAAHGNGPLRTAATELGVEYVPLRHLRRDLSLVQDSLGLAELIRLFRRVRPDIVHVNSSKAGILGRAAAAICRIPVTVFTAHGWAFSVANRQVAGVYRRAEQLMRPLATEIICVCEADRRAGLAARTCDVRRTTVIPNAVQVEGVPQWQARSSQQVEIVGVGRLAEQKDFSTLIAAFASLPRGVARLRVFGDGPLRDELVREIAALELSDEVELAGEVEDVRPFLARADIFALTSRWEGLPISVLEAMAAGLPVVASSVDGLPEAVLDGKSGFLTAPGSAGEVAEALASLIANAGLREQFGREGRRRAEELFSLPRWRAAHLALYGKLLET